MTQKKATFCIAVYNDTETLKETIANIYETVVPEDIDIIVVDDSGTMNALELSMFPDVQLLINEKRHGVGYSLYRAVEAAKTDIVFPMGCDIRFSGDWMPRFLQVVKDNPKSIVCSVTAGLNVDRRFIKGGENKYYGSHILFRVTEANNRKSPLPFREYLECKWNGKIQGDVEPVGAILGAFYGNHRDWFLKISPWLMHRTWGNLEPQISMAYYINGGSCLIDTQTVTGHIFKAASSQKPVKDLIYNKLLNAYLYLPRDMEQIVFTWAKTLSGGDSALKTFEMMKPQLSELYKVKESLTDEQIRTLLKPTGVLDI
jgi:glycosyltransferase involved in cell wall biosynthesis